MATLREQLDALQNRVDGIEDRISEMENNASPPISDDDDEGESWYEALERVEDLLATKLDKANTDRDNKQKELKNLFHGVENHFVLMSGTLNRALAGLNPDRIDKSSTKLEALITQLQQNAYERGCIATNVRAYRVPDRETWDRGQVVALVNDLASGIERRTF